MTTWHENEPLSDVLWNANLSNFVPWDAKRDYLLILEITDTAREATIRELFARSCSEV